jgi:flagellar hook-associated protein 3 FlgL
MIQFLGSNGTQFLANLRLLQQQTSATEEQISSGYRINQPSDDPGEVGDVLQLESYLSGVTQVASNLSEVSGEVNTAEGALENATTILQQVQTIGAEGADSNTSAASRTTLSNQVEGLLQQLVSVADTQYNGQYVFAGDETGTAPYQVDLTSSKGVDQQVTAPAGRLIQDATGVTFAVSLTAQQIFDDQNPDGTPAADNVFAAVNSLRVALAGNNQTGINSSITSLQTASDYLSQQLAFYGGVQSQIQNATSVAQKFQLQYQTSIGQDIDTNVATAATNLTQEQASMQASLQAEGAMPTTTLFSFLSGSSGG